MELIAPTDPLSHSADLTTENIERLRELFPQAVTEDGGGKRIDFEVLRELLGGELATGDEKYGLNWHGKRAARRLALTPSTGTLRPVTEDSVDWDTTQNLMIEGDNLEVLKLLQMSYAGKVKMIYIDPPYNTGSDFVYKDDFRDSIGNYQRITGQRDAEGAKLTTNAESSGRFHTDWLNMMHPRLMLARTLLEKAGVIFISIDDAEVLHTKALCNEIFGEENFLITITWEKGRKNDSRYFSETAEYMHVYTRDKGALASSGSWRQRKAGIDEVLEMYSSLRQSRGEEHSAIEKEMRKYYANLLEGAPSKALAHFSRSDARGLYFGDNISSASTSIPDYEVIHPITHKPCKKPGRGWGCNPDEMDSRIAEGRVHFGIDESTVPLKKSYLAETDSSVKTPVIYKDGRAASLTVNNLLAPGAFQNPKDHEVLADLIAYARTAKGVILDFFAGSGSTGHAVFAQNAADNENRKFILVQLPQLLLRSQKEHKAAVAFLDSIGKPLQITELTKQRLRKASTKIKAENPLFHGDLGFRVFKLDTTSIRPWDPSLPVTEQRLLGEVDNILPGRTEQDLLYELLLKRGLELTVPIVERTLAGKQVFAISTGDLIACLAPHIESADVEPLAEGIVTWHKELAPPPAVDPNAPLEKPAKFDPPLVVFRDTAFADDVAKSNLTEILKQHSLTDVRSL